MIISGKSLCVFCLLATIELPPVSMDEFRIEVSLPHLDGALKNYFILVKVKEFLARSGKRSPIEENGLFRLTRNHPSRRDVEVSDQHDKD